MNIIEKIRAGRAILDWSQDDLASQSGVSKAAITNAERGATTPDQTTVEKIERAFNKEGVFFSSNAVEKRDLFIREFSTYLDVLEDIERTLPNGGEICVHCADDRRSSSEVIEKMARMREAGYRFKTTICEGNTTILGDVKDYRWIPENYFANSNVNIIYGRISVKHIVEGNVGKFIAINSGANAAIDKRQFDYWWKTGMPVGGKENG